MRAGSELVGTDDVTGDTAGVTAGDGLETGTLIAYTVSPLTTKATSPPLPRTTADGSRSSETRVRAALSIVPHAEASVPGQTMSTGAEDST